MSQSIITIFIFISHHSLLLYRIQIATSPYTTSTSYNTNEQLSYCDKPRYTLLSNTIYAITIT
jgi:hypothetical protein